MDTDVLKAALPVVGGALALLGGVFTFVSGRLRDAPDDNARSTVLSLTALWAAAALWFIGIALAASAAFPLHSIPLFCASLAIHWKLFLSGPEPASRKAIAMFALLCSVTMFAILFATVAYLTDRILSIQERNLELPRRSLAAPQPAPK